ncbi:N-acetylglucosaminyldiphosphodolichol N-acetylglucosaminyltransferase catalytic subunit alg13 [Coemansia sp. RSA 2049]|nr:N-acetylglucosaminyldiphosphodolichol N-acetylglucosaminyltransferase catalytic subunit alg13 [Coemansia sp. RSA 2049]KAJ2522172.1 N-acetylglucosaminyldiphosphodolichol N-acetylglucosaminyltransferase catalytic subunit alg13 [Coemansia sp. RSA 1939]KAJ2616314.1 N-acetylglucosaminyldiphosphodolichol N-acetylglucosaminyltransferase catalytic subunit alg13 [Coemansia sp. RSA 1804]
MSVFVTVGSTGFDELISVLSTREFLQSLRTRGFRGLVVQYGASGDRFRLPNEASEELGIAVTGFDYAATGTQQHMDGAELVITHGGAGSILDALRARRPVIVVANRRLMADHQCEVAEELGRAGHVVVASSDTLARAVVDGGFLRLSAFPNADPRPVGEIVDEEALLALV